MALKFLLILIILGFWFSGCKRNPAPEVRNLLKDTKQWHLLFHKIPVFQLEA
mgnify:CR=1 FL=1